jgi:hypothetical protein
MRIALVLILAAGTTSAQTCEIDLAAVEARIAELENNYGIVVSTVGCIVPTRPAHEIMCTAAENPKDDLWQMGRLDDLAWLHAVENATGQEVDSAKPPRDTDFLAKRDACTDVACLCKIFIEHTNASLGGSSPYPQ